MSHTPFDFEYWSVRAAKWGVAYRDALRDMPVRPSTEPGTVRASLPAAPPQAPEDMEQVFQDFETLIVPHMTHWQHPRFFAYFPANAAPASVVAEHLVNAMAAQCMLWQTSPAATELETHVLDWLRQALGLAEGFHGVIQDSGSSATLVAVLTMRERALKWQGNQRGLFGQKPLRIYASHQVHTSIDRALWVSGIGQDNLVRIPTQGPLWSMDPQALREAIKADLAAGMVPAGIIGSVGGTSIGGTDDMKALVEVAKEFDLYTHIDAAWAGSAMICPEFRDLWDAINGVDSVMFNPHKWLGAQFDCCAHFIRDPAQTVQTLAIQPEYLKTHGKDGLINYSEWSVPLGRRFRALKIWFLLRAYGLDGLQQRIRNHVTWAKELADEIAKLPDFEITTNPVLSLFSFRHAPKGVDDLDQHNLDLVNRINDEGHIYLTQTRLPQGTGKHEGRVAIRFQAGQFDCTRDDVMAVVPVLKRLSL